MDQGQIALQLMALYGKLRRATDDQVKAAVKHQIDTLVALLRGNEHVIRDHAPRQGQQGAAAGDD